MGEKEKKKEGQSRHNMRRCLKLARAEFINKPNVKMERIEARAIMLTTVDEEELLKRELIAGIKP